MAQSNAAGTIFGRVESPAGATVVLLNTDTGAKRSVTPDAAGRYTASAMPTGHYKIDLVRDGAVVSSTEADVIIGQGVDASFGAAALQSVQVTGRRNRIDVSNSNNGATFTAKELAKLPIAQTVDAIIQLAPNTTRADSRYAAGASFGGGGASENAYYINGFPTTNPLTQLGASELPFGAIAQAQILTGGFGAEFGRSVGGVVNVTTKSGTNNWEFGVSASITPNGLRSKEKDSYYPLTGAADNKETDGTLFRKNSTNRTTEKSYGAYLGGPIIKDKLFMFVAMETKKNNRENTNADSSTVGTSTSSSNAMTGWESRQDTVERYLAKFDWNVSDDHRLELTLMGDTGQQDRQLSGYNYATFSRGATTASQHYKNNAAYGPSVGADTEILRYTGNLTDALTVNALFGRSKTPGANRYEQVGSTPLDIFQIIADSNVRAKDANGNFLNYSSPQVLSNTVASNDSTSKIRSNRLDLEYKVGSHTLRAGLDNNKLTSSGVGDYYGGGGIWRYAKAPDGASAVHLGDVTTTTGANPLAGPLAAQGYYVSKRLQNSLTDAKSEQTAQYIEDRYQATKDVLITAGLRNEGFKNVNGAGETFLEVKSIISPRLSGVWDVHGDASMKVFGSAGRYALQIPTHLAVRGGSASVLTRQGFTYTGTDQYGQPTGLIAMAPAYSVNNELGQPKDPKTVTALDIKATYQDEITLGFEKAFSPSLNFGAKATYRQLKATIDDYCDARLILAYADSNGIDRSKYAGFTCASFNPGEDATFLVDFANTRSNYTKIKLTKEQLGFEKAKRTYTAVDLFAEHPMRNGWYGRVNYTWSRSTGNTEGQTRSDNAQTDVAATSTWDNPELMVGANGLLPNDREHQFKAFGFYELTPEWTVGANGLLASGRPRNCFGWNPNVPGEVDYSSVYFYCEKAQPRGTMGRLPWDVRLDMNVAFRPQQIKGLTLKVDVFNLFNKQTAQTIDETYNVDSSTNISPTYGRVISYTAPRSVKLTAEYNYKF
ncbi:TonB-dependent receptor [Janthinobacterium fluminis]|uniref:TonB-dependent receptor plug domain-containing protein n=1 Tax=Janthinobacterium fluminis TaxID=2987524 RepID=A0ABT5JWY1_9BURK|nr:TonB-dependent receptor plug domain-containing protein [Janthinobacterium fluminis]MDC8757254.1 TonB-dependent receptor plug domain-containing protein [Janthinobacterium fluminis]